MHSPHHVPGRFENAATPAPAQALFYTARGGCAALTEPVRRSKKPCSRTSLGAVFWLGLLGVLGSAYAGPTRYVTDEFTITLRSGAGNQYRILKLLPTGTAVEVLERGEGWTRVDTAEGQEGWVSSQYLISHPPAAQRLRQLSAELAQRQAQDGQIKQQMEKTQQQLAQARERVRELSSERARLTQRLDASREGFNLATENKQLKKQVIDLERRLQDLANETERLADRSRQDWFLVGSGVLLAGMLVGIIMTRIRWRRRSSWGDL
ncbi:MAG: TIGR04211 family SH3 domain-containing protein [Nitrococcus mobilis]|nr:TIGR04211 family SH3 domain-containing protein [Nitrococcus mobilis]